jgi:hypothetical protein
MQKLREKTFVASAKQVARNHASWLRSNKHLRYMWLPYTDSVVVVQVNPDGPPATPAHPGRHVGLDTGAGMQQDAGAAALSAYGDVVQEDAVSDRWERRARLIGG